DLEQEMEREKRELLERAARMRLEQEDEMRELNSLLLTAKCSSILDRQVAEKRLIHEELAAEERRLNGIMEAERAKGLEFQEELERRRKQELISTKLEVLGQMEQHREQRALRAEQKFQEGRRVLERLEQMKREDQEAWQQQQQRQRQLRAEMRRADSENRRLRERERDRDRRDEQRALEEQRLKGEREAALEAERARVRRERQRELDRVRDMQERDRGWQEARDALRTQRSQEAAERAWRRRELEQERRRAGLVRDLQRQRGEQVALRRQELALHLEQERRDFLTLLSGHQEQLEREQQEQERRERARRDHAEALRGQIRELRQRRQRDRAAAIEEGQRQLREARERCQRLAQIGRQKLQRLRDTGVPDRYCARVERK
ncbi:CFA45 protein, partial [Struthidea cinerea]|nr:CFA45 protein [Struthidea cinerea]